MAETNLQLPVTLLDIQNQYMIAGNDMYTAKGASTSQFNTMVREQILARATRDYYDWMLLGLACVIIILLLFPGIQRVMLRIRKGNIPY
ncbi:hypothetical protein OWR28_17515 [Chryseobacterium sp. 1B4]